jgi:adenylosuccinate lyase
MIDRYSRPQMKAIWDPENRYRKWLDVELAIAEGWAKIGRIPSDAPELLRRNCKVDVPQILKFEEEVKHDLIAFIKGVTSRCGDEQRWLHFGVTSYDVEDTATALMMCESLDLIAAGTIRLRDIIWGRAVEHKYTLMIGRTHAVHAEATTFGLKLSVWVSELTRHLTRLSQAREQIRYGQVSGAVGSHANVPVQVEEYVCEKLGLNVAPASTQILQRDRHAHVLTSLALLAGSLEKFGIEIRNLSRTEIAEVREYFAGGQRGSSAMPHKRNPELSERVCGLARTVRANALVALENMAQWHERDLSNSSAERIIFPDAFLAVDYMLDAFCRVMEHLVVEPQNMRRNLELLAGVTNSEQVMLALIEKGKTREEAYKLVQAHAMAAQGGGDFKMLLKSDPLVMSLLSEAELEHSFSDTHHLQAVDEIMARVEQEMRLSEKSTKELVNA